MQLELAACCRVRDNLLACQAGTLTGSPAGAALYFNSRGSHPHVETDKTLRSNPVAEERLTATDEGHNYRDSIGRRISA